MILMYSLHMGCLPVPFPTPPLKKKCYIPLFIYFFPAKCQILRFDQCSKRHVMLTPLKLAQGQQSRTFEGSCFKVLVLDEV